MKKETYSFNLKGLVIEIPKGIRVKNFIQNMTCEVCGCSACIVSTTLN